MGDPDFPSDIAKAAHACLLGLCGLLPPSPAAFPGVRSLLVCWLSLAFSPLRVWLVRPVRLFVRGPGWCWWLPLLCGFGLLCWRGRFCLFGLAVFFLFVCLCCLSPAGLSVRFVLLLFPPLSFLSGPFVCLAPTCATKVRVYNVLVCLTADWSGSPVLFTFTG